MRQLTMEITILCILLLSSLTQCFGFATPCHPKCKCFWWRGKQTADCSSAGFETIPVGLEPNLQVLNLTRNGIPVLSRNAFLNVGLINLQKVYLASCGIERIDDSALRQLSNLVELDLSDNSLSSIPSEAFRDLPSLRMLDLSGNPLGVIPARAFADLKSLKILNMTDCGIHTIAARAFEGVEKLERLSIGGNELTTLGLETLELLLEIRLTGNPWTCDCELMRFQQWLRDHAVAYIEPTCYQPDRLRGKKWNQMKTDDFECPSTFLNTTTVDVVEEDERGIISMVIGMVLEILFPPLY